MGDRIEITEEDLGLGAPTVPPAPHVQLPAATAPPVTVWALHDQPGPQGYPTAPAPYAAAPQAPAPPAAWHPNTLALPAPPAPPVPPRVRRFPGWFPWATGGGIFLLAGVIATILLLNGDGRAEYRMKMQEALRPMTEANGAVASAMSTLDGPGTSSARVATATARTAVDDARSALSSLAVPDEAAGDLRAARQALARETAYVEAINGVLRDPAGGRREQAIAAEQALRSALEVVAPDSEDWAGEVSGAAQLSEWARSRSRARQRRAAEARAQREREEAEQSANAAAAAAAAAAASQPKECGEGVSTNGTTSCPFALDVRRAWLQVPSQTATVEVFSAAAGRTISMYCTPVGGGIRCTGGRNASVFF